MPASERPPGPPGTSADARRSGPAPARGAASSPPPRPPLRRAAKARSAARSGPCPGAGGRADLIQVILQHAGTVGALLARRAGCALPGTAEWRSSAGPTRRIAERSERAPSSRPGEPALAELPLEPPAGRLARQRLAPPPAGLRWTGVLLSAFTLRASSLPTYSSSTNMCAAGKGRSARSSSPCTVARNTP